MGARIAADTSNEFKCPRLQRGIHTGKEPVFALVERGGKARSFHLPDVKGGTLREIVNAHLDGKTVVYTDDNRATKFAAGSFEGMLSLTSPPLR